MYLPNISSFCCVFSDDEDHERVIERDVLEFTLTICSDGGSGR